MNKYKSITAAMNAWIMVIIGVAALACGLAMGSWAQSNEDPLLEDNVGRIKGITLDAQTGGPASEVFKILVYDSLDNSFNSRALINAIESDAYGRFDFKLKPGSYYLQFIPKSFSSKYESEPCVLISDRKKTKINVYKGKITRVQKSIRHGGTLKILLVDPLGNKFNPSSLLRGSKVDTTLYSKYLLGEPSSWGEESLLNLSGGDRLDDGEAIVHRLPEGEYSIVVHFGYIGYGGKEMNGIKVKMDETIVCKITVDLNDGTGIAGKIVDQNGTPLSDLIVEFNAITDNCYSGNCKTDGAGNYRIVGLNAGSYKMIVSSHYNDNRHVFKSINNILIQKSIIMHKNISVERD